MEFVAFDVETTGLSPEACRLTELGAVRFDLAGNVLGRFESLCRPGVPIPDEVVRLTGIDDAMVFRAPPPLEVVESFLAFAKGALWVAHNALFDGSFVVAELERAGQGLPPVELVDTLDWARRAAIPVADHRLETVARSFHIHPAQLHRAAADAESARGIFLGLLERTGGTDRSEAALRTLLKPFGLEMCRVQAVKLRPELADLPELIAARQRIDITYDGGSQGSAPRPVTPLSLTHIGPVSYLIAMCHRDNREKQFRLDRIRSLNAFHWPPRPGGGQA